VTEQENKAAANVTEALANAQKRRDRLLRNKQALVFCSSKIPIVEKLLKSAIKLAEEYAESVVRLSKELEQLKKRHEFALKYVTDNDEDYQDAIKAEELAKKIVKLQKALAEKKKQFEDKFGEMEVGQ
jgi:7-keto-8-aminopelargonate synthetase-like enzyme